MKYRNTIGNHISRISITVNSSELPSATCLHDFALERLNSAIDEMIYNKGGGAVNIVQLKERSYNDTIFESIENPSVPVNCIELMAYYTYQPETSIVLFQFSAGSIEFAGHKNLYHCAMRKLYKYLIENNLKASDIINIDNATTDPLYVTLNVYIKMEGNNYDS